MNTYKKWFLGLIILLALGAGGFYVLKMRVGDLRPVLLPPLPHSTSQPNTPGTTDQIGRSTPFPIHAPAGFTVGLYAQNVPAARDMVFSPKGTLLISMTSQGKVATVVDNDGDGFAETNKIVLSGLKNPHGLAFYNGKLYVAEENIINRYIWNESARDAVFETKILDLPSGGRHFTRVIEFSTRGTMYVTLGSTCDSCIEKSPWIGTVITADANGKGARVYAKGLRNSPFIRMNPLTHELWGTEMGRDFLGDETPPDEVNIIRDGKDYGWPRCYGDQIPDHSFNAGTSMRDCQQTVPPVYKIPAHSAPLGLAFIPKGFGPDETKGDLLVAYHGSWNRSVPTGYKIVRMKVAENKITGETDFLTGFLEGSSASGRPVDVEFDAHGSLYVSDDKAGSIYKVVYVK